MPKRVQFQYVTYIATTPTRVWSALIDPAQTRQYWQQQNVSDWKPGSRWEHRGIDKKCTLRLVGKVLEVTPPRCLVVTWAFPADEARANKHTQVTFAIAPYRHITCLTVTHDRLEPGSDMLKGITEGWPMVLASLKSFLETGRPLPKLW